MHRIGEDVSEKLDYQPGVFTVQRHVPGDWACRCCHAESGEASFGEIGEAIAARLGLGRVQHLTADAALRLWGERTAFYSLGSNSRVRALRARRELGWAPRHNSVIDWIATAMPVGAGH